MGLMAFRLYINGGVCVNKGGFAKRQASLLNIDLGRQNDVVAVVGAVVCTYRL